MTEAEHKRPSTAQIAFAIFTIALLVRLLAIHYTGWSSSSFGDARDYLDHARVICEGGQFPARGNLPFFRAPLLPFFIAVSTGCTQSLAAAKMALAVCDSLSCVLIGLLALQLWNVTRAAVAASLIAALNPFFILATTDVRSEPLFMLLFTGAIVCLVLASRSASPASSGAAGLLLSLAALTRPAALALIPVFAIGVFFVSEGLKLKRAVLLTGMALITLAPWTLRNWVVYGELIVVNDAGAYNLWRGSHPALEAVLAEESPTARHQGSIAFEVEGARIASEIERVAPTHEARQSEWRKRAMEQITADPERSLSYAATKAWMYWRPWLDRYEHSTRAVVVSGVVNGVLYLVSLASLVRVWRRERSLALFVFAMFAVAWLVHIPYQVVMRFRIPITDPTMIALAAGALVAMVGTRSPAPS